MARDARARSRPRAESKAGASPATYKRVLWIYAALFATTLAVYVRTAQFGFVNFDDPDSVTANPHVFGGLTAQNIAWAFTSGDAANWFPLTRLSHILDYALFGPASGAHHLMNAFFHAISTLLLFAFLNRATRRRWLSGWVALIFALHPLHVESVAWISERKDVLSTLFAMLALWAYVRWTERPSTRRYVLVAAALGLGLLAKPMVLTLPLIFLLLDRWPLGRAPQWREKLPLFVMSAASATVTLLVQNASGAVRTTEQFPLFLRIENAATSYVLYLIQWFWPAHLAVFYPYPPEIPAWRAGAAAIMLAAISLAAVRAVNRRPWFAIGWFWYVIMLMPVTGLIQVGAQAHADRYTYMPMIGISMAIAWAAAEIASRIPRAKTAVVAAAVASCSIAAALTWLQLGVWRDSRTLFQHAVNVTGGNYLAHHNLGVALAESPDGLPQAVTQFQEALRIKPDSVRARTDLGSAYAKLGRLSEAVSEFRTVLTLEPDVAIPHNNLGNVYAQLGNWDQAIAEYTAALRLNPEYPDARQNLAQAEYNKGLSLAKSGQKDEAAAHFEAALRARPDYPEAHNNLGVVLSQEPARLNEAIGHFEAALQLAPNYADAHVNLGVALSQIPGRIADAIAQLEAANRIQPDPELRQMISALRSRQH